MVLIAKELKKDKWETEWRQVVKWGSKLLNDPAKTEKIDNYTKGGEEITKLRTAWAEKEKKLKKDKDNLVEAQDAIRKEKDTLETGGRKGTAAWKKSFTDFKESTWQTVGWDKKVVAHYPSTYLNNLYAVDGQSFKITEDQATKILARVIYEIGKLDKGNLTANWDLKVDSDPTATVAEGIFDRIKRCSDEIEAIRSKDSSREGKIKNDDGSEKDVGKWDDRENKVWDLPFTYSERKEVYSANDSPNNYLKADATHPDGSNNGPINLRYSSTNSLQRDDLAKTVYEFITKVLKDDIVNKLDKGGVTQKETNFKIYQAGDAYDDDTLKAYGIEVQDKWATTLYRTTKFDETTKKWGPTEKMNINIQEGLKDWIKLFKSVFSGKEAYEKFDEGLKATDPNYLLFQDLTQQAGVNDPFTIGGVGYRLPESLEGLKKCEEDFLLGQGEKIQDAQKLQAEVEKGKREITKKETENKKLRAGIQEISDEVSTKKKEELKAYKLEDGIEGVHKRDWITLRKIQKLILEIRFLDNNGDATRRCDFEKSTTYLNDLVGYVPDTAKDAPDGNLVEANKVNVYKDKNGNDVKDFEFVNGKLEKAIADDVGEIRERYYLFDYFKHLSLKDTIYDVNHAIQQIRDGKDDLLDDMETKEKFRLYKKHFEIAENNSSEKFNSWEEEAKNAITKALGEDTGETAQDWRNKLKEIDASLDDSALINDAWKASWIALGDKFKTGDQVKALFSKVKDKADFLTELPTLSGETGLNTLKAMAAKKPKEIIKYIESYCYNHLKDDAANEKDKQKTQMKRRLAKALNKSKESDLDDGDIPENLVKWRTGELIVDETKYYTADLKEVSPDKGPKKDDNETQSKWWQWEHPMGKTLYISGAILLVLGILAVVYWDEVKNKWNEWFGGEDKDEIE